jgi:cytochrome P450
MISHAITNLEQWYALDLNWLRSYTLNIVMAGHETTTNTMAGGVIALLEHRDQWQALCADPSLAENAVHEILRYATGVPTWRQRAVKDLEISGMTIPAGAKVYVALHSANRDEEVFGDDSETFDIRRKNASRHLAFGTGAHTCLGNSLAELEMRIMLEELARVLPQMELVPNQRYTFSRNTSQRGPEHVRVRW